MKSSFLRDLLLFWLTFLFLGGVIFYPTLYYYSPRILIIFLLLLGAGVATWLVVQTRQGQKLPHIGLGWVWLIGLVAALLSTLLSPNPRVGLERTLWLGAAVFILYLLLAIIYLDDDVQPILDGALWVSGIVALSATTETAAWYSSWRDAVGSTQIAPMYPYRFASFLGHANVYMGFMNLWAPIAVSSLVKAKTRLRRVLLLVWLVLYALSIPFSSSRGGWVGMVIWIGVLVILWSTTQPWFSSVWRWVKQKWFFSIIAAVILLGIAVVVYVALSKSVTTHPTHGSSLFGSRGDFILIALRAWQMSPWGGMGPGRFAFGWLEQGYSIPPGWWPVHAHNLWTQSLAEYGPLGFLALCALLISGGCKLYSAWKSTPADHKLVIAAAIAGSCAWLVQSLVDDFSGSPHLLISLAIFAASCLTWVSVKIRSGKWSIGWLLVPLVLLVGYSSWSLWSSIPSHLAAKAGEEGYWAEAAAGFEESLAFDPQLPSYSFHAGFARAMLWWESRDEHDLALARQYLLNGIQLESGLVETAFRKKEDGYALWWANLAVLDFQAGDVAQAEEHIRLAIAIAPDEATFYLNLGWMMEELGRDDEAVLAYQKVLDLKPSYASHPFWKGSAIREEIRQSVPEMMAAPTYKYLKQAEQALRQGDIIGAQRALAFSGLAGEPVIARQVMQARVAQARGEEMAALLEVRDTLSRRQLDATSVILMDPIYYRMNLLMNLVPGYARLDAEHGQYQLMERLHTLQVQQGNCAEAARTWEIWHESMSGGFLAELPPAPACP
ncbi:MAG: O-antigen ligase family protein [Anaerolineaceae bacterium]|nr:O-antigen ligase family protein [Anaerolineaceae bacterium]